MSTSGDPASALGEDWLGVCARAAAAVRRALSGYRTIAERAQETGRGEGGDVALVIDRVAEDAIFEELESLGVGLSAVSEERGSVEVNGGGPVRVVIDPVDGSLNAKRGLPFHCVSIAVARADSMRDVEFGYVHDLPSGDDWWARRGGGAFLNGDRLPMLSPGKLEVLGLESGHPRLVAQVADALVATGARRIRCLGAIALTLCNVAAGRLDGMVSLAPCRSVDAAAGQLIVREVGGAVAFPDAAADMISMPLGLEIRSRVGAARGPAELAALVNGVFGRS